MRPGTLDHWSDTTVQRIQHLLDSSLARAGSVQQSFFGKPERRLAAADFLHTWNSIYMCAISTHGASAWPHLAAIKLEFDPEGNLPMLLYTESARARDLASNHRVALQKQLDDGTVLTCYAKAEFLGTPQQVDARGRTSTRLLLRPVRLFGIGPFVHGPLATTAPK